MQNASSQSDHLKGEAHESIGWCRSCKALAENKGPRNSHRGGGTGGTTADDARVNLSAIGYPDVVDNLLSTSTDLPLSANQGRVLNAKTVAIETYLSGMFLRRTLQTGKVTLSAISTGKAASGTLNVAYSGYKAIAVAGVNSRNGGTVVDVLMNSDTEVFWRALNFSGSASLEYMNIQVLYVKNM